MSACGPRPGTERLTRDGFDRIWLLHPSLVWAGVVLLDLVVVLGLLTAVLYVVDKVEDRLAPGGTEWIAL